MKMKTWHIVLITVIVICGALSIKVASVLSSGGRLVQVMVSDGTVVESREFALNYRRLFLHGTPHAETKPSDVIADELTAEGFGSLLPFLPRDGGAVWYRNYLLGRPGPSITIQGAMNCDGAAVSSLVAKAAKGSPILRLNKVGYQIRGTSRATGRVFDFNLINTPSTEPGNYQLFFNLDPLPGSPNLSLDTLKAVVPPGPGVRSGHRREPSRRDT